MPYEWTYIFILLLCTVAVVVYPITDNVHRVFMLVGSILTALTFFSKETKIEKFKLKAFALQLGIGNIALAIPTLTAKSTAIFTAGYLSLLIAVVSEEVYRIASYKWVMMSFKSPELAVVVSSIVFASMHMYWYPTQWLYAIAGGALLSILLIFGSETACIGTHYMFNLMTFNMIHPVVFWLISIISLISGLALYKKVGVE